MDSDLANSLTKLQTYVETRRALESSASMVRTTIISQSSCAQEDVL